MKHLFRLFVIKSWATISMLLYFLTIATTTLAQDFHLSQYDAAPLFLNPSMTGMFDGQYRAHLHYRTQWSSITTKPFTTAGASFDMPIKKFGIGAQIINFRAGAGGYNALNSVLSSSYDLADKSNTHHLTIGAQAGIIQKSIVPEKLIFGIQYDYANGGGFNTNLPNGETFATTSFIVPSLNAGLLYYYAKATARLNPFIGVAAFNLTEPVERFFDAPGNKLYRRLFFHGGAKIIINERIQLLPKFIFMTQKQSKETTLSLFLNYFLKDADTYLLIGPTYRFKDAAIIEAGIKRKSWFLRVSYDINTSPLKNISYYKGGFEISLTYIFKKTRINHPVSCPRL